MPAKTGDPEPLDASAKTLIDRVSVHSQKHGLEDVQTLMRALKTKEDVESAKLRTHAGQAAQK